MDQLDDLKSFWDTQKILEEFDRDDITPVMGSGKFEVPVSEPINEGIATTKMPDYQACYICNEPTSIKLTKGDTPVCVDCILQHLT